MKIKSVYTVEERCGLWTKW